MRRILALLLLSGAMTGTSHAQTQSEQPFLPFSFPSVPFGACTNGTSAINQSNGVMSYCINGTWTASVVSPATGTSPCMAFSATPVFNYDSTAAENTFCMTLTGNITSSSLTGTVPQWRDVRVQLTQDAVGNHTWVCPPNFLDCPNLIATPNARAMSASWECVTLGGCSNGTGTWQNTDVGPIGITGLPPGWAAPTFALGKIVFDGQITAIPTGTGNSTTATAPAITTSQANDVVLWFWQLNAANFSANPATGTNLVNAAFSAGKYGAFVNYQLQGSAGTVGSVSGTFAASQLWDTGTVALAPIVGQTPSLTASTPVQQASGATIAATLPAGVAPGDFVIPCLEYFTATGAVNTITLPNNYLTRIVFSQDTSGVNHDTLACWIKKAGSSEPASYTFTQSVTTNGISAFVIDVKNVLAVDDLVTSPSASFSSNDLNKDFCISAQPNTCGTIAAVLSGTTLLCTTCAATVTQASAEYRYGPDNSTALQNALTAGGKILLPYGEILANLANLPNFQLAWPQGASVVLEGAAPAVANWGFAGGAPFSAGTAVHNPNVGSEIDIASSSLAAAAMELNGGANGIVANVYSNTIQDMSFWGGAGTGQDGGGCNGAALNCFGLQIQNASNIVFRNTVFANFTGSDVDASRNGTTGYIDRITTDNSWFMLSGGDGFHLYNGTGTTTTQNFHFQNSQFDNNAGAGLHLSGVISTINLITNNFQRNGATSQILIDGGTTFSGCKLEGNYFETDSGGAGALNIVAGLSGCSFDLQQFIGITAPGLANVATGVSTNTDTGGTLTASTNAVTYTFKNTGYTSHPICTASDETAAAGSDGVKVTYTAATSVTFTTTGASDVIDYICIPRN